MTASALVSIITPAYNAAPFIGEAICSVQGQDCTAWEMLVVDDGSLDATAEIVAQSASADPRIRLIRQKNSGPAQARQRALDAANYRFIAFLDSDDRWLPGKLSKQLSFMRRVGAALSYTRYRRINHDGTTLGHLIDVPERLDYRSLLGNTAIATSTAIVDRERTGPFRLQPVHYDDFALWLELTKRGFVAHGLNEDLMRYRILQGSYSRNKARSAVQVWRTYLEIEKLGPSYAAWCLARYAFNAWRKHRNF